MFCNAADSNNRETIHRWIQVLKYGGTNLVLLHRFLIHSQLRAPYGLTYGRKFAIYSGSGLRVTIQKAINLTCLQSKVLRIKSKTSKMYPGLGIWAKQRFPRSKRKPDWFFTRTPPTGSNVGVLVFVSTVWAFCCTIVCSVNCAKHVFESPLTTKPLYQISEDKLGFRGQRSHGFTRYLWALLKQTRNWSASRL